MRKLASDIDDETAAFIRAQKLFFVATAPLSREGHVNLSPKGLDSIIIRDPHCIAYADLTGSGAETLAHLKENGRIVLMFCAFEGVPNIVRVHGRGQALEPGDDGYEDLLAVLPRLAGTRCIVRVDVTRVSKSCGHGVPIYHLESERTLVEDFARKKGDAGLRAYWAEKNATSVDGLPGLKPR